MGENDEEVKKVPKGKKQPGEERDGGWPLRDMRALGKSGAPVRESGDYAAEPQTPEYFLGPEI